MRKIVFSLSIGLLLLFPAIALAADSSVCRPPAAIGECPTGQDFFYSATYGEKVCQARVTCGAGQSMNCDSGCTTPAAGPVCTGHTVDIGTSASCCADGQVAQWNGSAWVCASAGSDVWASGSTGIYYTGGNVGIGLNNPTVPMDVNGSIRGKYDTDTTSYFGRAAVGYAGHSDYASFAHIDQNTMGGYALLQSSVGDTFLNAASGKSILFRENNADKMVLVGGKLGIGDTTPDATLDVEGDVVVQNLNMGGGADVATDLVVGGLFKGRLNTYINEASINIAQNTESESVTASCDSGDLALSGGCDGYGVDTSCGNSWCYVWKNDIRTKATYMSGITGWYCRGKNSTTSSQSYTAKVLCLDVDNSHAD